MTNDTTMMNQARDEQRKEYETVLSKVQVEATGERLSDTQAGNYLSTGFAQGFMNGYQTSAGASHAGLTVVIGAIDAGTVDLETVKKQLIELRNAIKSEAGL